MNREAKTHVQAEGRQTILNSEHARDCQVWRASGDPSNLRLVANAKLLADDFLEDQENTSEGARSFMPEVRIEAANGKAFRARPDDFLTVFQHAQEVIPYVVVREVGPIKAPPFLRKYRIRIDVGALTEQFDRIDAGE